jgi:beta-phosphoglucomutase
MLRTILFDFNGILVDDEPLHCALFQKVLSQKQIVLVKEDYYKKYLGFDDHDAFKAVLEAAGISPSETEIQKLIEAKAALYEREAAQKDLFVPGSLDFVKKVSENYFLGIVSGALRREIEAWLDRGKIRSLFQVIVAAEDIQKGKPDPEGFYRALAFLNRDFVAASEMILPQECLVIEDSMWGVEAAQSAGMKCLALATSYPKETFKKAEWVSGGFSEIPFQKIVGAFKEV